MQYLLLNSWFDVNVKVDTRTTSLNMADTTDWIKQNKN